MADFLRSKIAAGFIFPVYFLGFFTRVLDVVIAFLEVTKGVDYLVSGFKRFVIEMIFRFEVLNKFIDFNT